MKINAFRGDLTNVFARKQNRYQPKIYFYTYAFGWHHDDASFCNSTASIHMDIGNTKNYLGIALGIALKTSESR